MGIQVVAAILSGGPFRVRNPRLPAKLVGDSDSLGQAVSFLHRRPVSRLELRKSCPIAAGIGNDIFPVHRFILSRLQPSASEPIPRPPEKKE